jgi:DNA-3-methyladenine glycosylase I
MRCPWPQQDELMIHYHDHEWGKPVHEDTKLFEMLLLESFQAGLTWKTILHRREGFRKAFSDFDVQKVAAYTEKEIAELMQDVGIIRHQLKIKAAINNANLFISIQKEHGSFDCFIWSFTNGKTIINNFRNHQEIPANSLESDLMSKALKKKGFKFMGSTICYAFMQAAGMVNDHLITCNFR